jgi:hypothetical protein
MTTRPTRILLQTTIPTKEDDWHVGRFSLLRSLLESQVDGEGAALYEVVARDRSGCDRDSILTTLDTSGFDELWLFGVDDGGGLHVEEREGISRFHRGGGGLLVTRDHQDVGSSVCELGCVGGAHYFHSRGRKLDLSRQLQDDRETKDIFWPNYHSGGNGEFQAITPTEPVHELLMNPASLAGVVEYFPAHPHEGAVAVPQGEQNARVIATGRSQVTGRTFNLAVAFERVGGDATGTRGRAVAESSFHHFADYNWDISQGCPSFVSEPPCRRTASHGSRLADIHAYACNLARWLARA